MGTELYTGRSGLLDASKVQEGLRDLPGHFIPGVGATKLAGNEKDRCREAVSPENRKRGTMEIQIAVIERDHDGPPNAPILEYLPQWD
jgi:hypothetical protein